MSARADRRMESGGMASTSRKSKRRFRVDSGTGAGHHRRRSRRWRAKRECIRQREFMTAGADILARHRDAGAVSGNSGGQAGGRNLSTRRPQRFLAEVESSEASAKNARAWRCLGRNRLTEGVFVKTAISVLRVGLIILALPSVGGDKSSLPCKGDVPASQTIDERNVPGAWNVGGFFLCG